MTDRIKVLRITPLEPGGTLKAFASIEVNGVTVHGARIVQQPGKEAWVAMPQKETEHNGRKKFFPIVEIHDRALRAAIEEKVLRVLNTETCEE